MKKTYSIEVDCANCANKMEEAISKLPEISSATVNFMTQKLAIEYGDSQNEEKLIKAITKVCRKIDSDFEIN